MSDQFRDGMDEFTGEYAKGWKPKAGEMVCGEIVTLEPVVGEFGPVMVCTIADEEAREDIAVWISPKVLRDRFQMLQPKVGERIAIKALTEGKGERTGRSYKRFEVRMDRTPEAQRDFEYGGSVDPAGEAREKLLAEADKYEGTDARVEHEDELPF